jgi:hypothetical protein
VFASVLDLQAAAFDHREEGERLASALCDLLSRVLTLNIAPEQDGFPDQIALCSGRSTHSGPFWSIFCRWNAGETEA